MRRLHRPTRGLWRNLDFLKLWAGQSISEFGSQVSLLAVPWLAALELEATPFEFAMLGMLVFLPFILFALPAGVWVDRLRRRPILIVGDAARAVLIGYIPIAWALGILDIGQLLMLQFLIGTFTVLFDVAYQSYLPAVVERDELVEGNSKLQTTVSAAQIAGPGLAGVLIGLMTAPYAIALDAASFVASTAFLLRIRKTETLPERAEDAPRPRMWPELKEGVAYVVRHPTLKWIACCTGTSNFFGSIAFSIALLYIARVLGVSAFWAGAVFAGFGVGSLIGAVSATRFQRALGIGPAIVVSISIGAVAAFAFPLAPASLPVPVLLAGTLLFGVGAISYNIAQVSYRQAITPERLQGRMNASMRWIVWGTIPLGSLVGGALGSTVSLRFALWVSAVGSLAGILPVALTSVRSLRELPEQADEPTPAEAQAAGGVLEPTTAPLGADAT